MTAYQFYRQHFTELTPHRRFHFATRMRCWASLGFIDLPPEDLAFFEQYIKAHRPKTSYKRLETPPKTPARSTKSAIRKPYFKKYPWARPLEAVMCHLIHMEAEYGENHTSHLLKHCPLEKLEKRCNRLLADTPAILNLSTFAVNSLCLIDHFLISAPKNPKLTFKIENNPLAPGDIYLYLIYIALKNAKTTDPTLITYLITHVIICDSGFYSAKIPENHQKSYQKALAFCEKSLLSPDTLSLDVLCEFLVASRLCGYKPQIRPLVASKCRQNLAHGYLRDPACPTRIDTFEHAEHRNALFIMSGLDQE